MDWDETEQCSMKIKTIIFDFGGVLFKTPDVDWLKRWGKIFGLKDDPEIIAILANPNESELMDEICLGHLDEDVLWQMMIEKLQIGDNLIKKIKRQSSSKKQLNQPMVKLLANLHQSYQTSILSNAGNQTRSLMVDAFGLDKYVEEIVISAEEGVIKPDPAIYEIALARLNASPETSLFLDDYLPNVEAARELGMNAVQFIDNRQAAAEIQSFLMGGA